MNVESCHDSKGQRFLMTDTLKIRRAFLHGAPVESWTRKRIIYTATKTPKKSSVSEGAL
jgi:hypothetical protein